MDAYTLDDARTYAVEAIAGEGGTLAQYGDEAIAVAAGEFPRNANGYALVQGLLVKAGAATLYGFSGYNNGAAQFIHVFDAADFSNLTSSSIPEVVVGAPGASNFSYAAGNYGRRFTRGIVIATSSTLATYTAGASANCWFDVQFV